MVLVSAVCNETLHDWIIIREAELLSTETAAVKELYERESAINHTRGEVATAIHYEA